jgi:short-subunit dehydrogenase
MFHLRHAALWFLALPMDKYAVITGASKGIGRSIAVELAARNYNLVLIARSEPDLVSLKAELTATYSVKVEILVKDLSQPGSSLEVNEWLDDQSIPVAVLVNNAGYGLWGSFEDVELGKHLNMLQLNINAVLELTYYLLPALKKNDQAYILNIASTAAYQAVPTLGLYSASKAFILSFTRALRFELKDSPVSVTCVCPGPVDTGFAERAGLNSLSKMAQKFNMKPDDLAKAAVEALFDKKSEVIPGLVNKISAFATRFLPKSFIEKTAAGIYKTQ